jgi:hypothetical protein
MKRLLSFVVLFLPFSVIALLALNISLALAIGDRPEAKNMRLVGFNNLQARSAYQPIIHKQGNRWIAYIGHHGGSAVNPMTKSVEPNGTSIVDVTDPRRPVYLKHLPGGAGVGEAGGAQMVRACNGSDLPNANKDKIYLLRGTSSSHEVYDVTDPSNPVLVTTIVSNLGDTHKNFWECDTGIAYLVSDGTSLGTSVPSFPAWRAERMTQIFDLSNPADPKFVRNWGLVGQEPGSTSVMGPARMGSSRLSIGKSCWTQPLTAVRLRLISGPTRQRRTFFARSSAAWTPRGPWAHTPFSPCSGNQCQS